MAFIYFLIVVQIVVGVLIGEAIWKYGKSKNIDK